MSRDPSGPDDMVPTQHEAETEDTCSQTREFTGDSNGSNNNQAANAENHAPASAEDGPNPVGLDNPNNPSAGWWLP
ncbi:uncharacterized protein EI90DRAFT_3126604 [Cantharellus anzutake]|uniref:uncharacterized protein n=1 Tax=Cantharellus anzutake TaxID=1750568 RepID=UPI0019087BE3|nr:uncharacterized protein EI90DRAFT_3132578 [Cantharellus anzutake]XP_038913910.1 uncharacterized protein EI90DRAFT_3126604 [Cantharellus anzutake]KAF8319467.1 hypothetical protein EI90DRAFT_3132578 [Cantharellus anzutake]KAF8327958.1 hypothetical protein EI90DRAFT_3126604 [Cantharellus anzutake]